MARQANVLVAKKVLVVVDCGWWLIGWLVMVDCVGRCKCLVVEVVVAEGKWLVVAVIVACTVTRGQQHELARWLQVTYPFSDAIPTLCVF